MLQCTSMYCPCSYPFEIIKSGLIVLNNLVHFLQVDAEKNEDKSFFFMSDDALTCDKLMILIHGSGVVRAGQWARRLLTWYYACLIFPSAALYSGTLMKWRPKGLAKFVCYTDVFVVSSSFIYDYFTTTGVRKSQVILGTSLCRGLLCWGSTVVPPLQPNMH